MSRFDHSLSAGLRNLAEGAQVLIVDVDGVLLNNLPRLHHICEIRDGHIEYKTEGADWEAYEREAPKDTPLPLCKMLRRLSMVYALIFLTARSESQFQVSTFIDAISPFIPGNEDWYYQFKDTSPQEEDAVEYKRRIVKKIQAAGLDVVAAIDDSLENINMFKQEGICVLRCHDTINEHSMEY